MLIKINDVEIDTAKFAGDNANAMLSRGVRHFLGNEVSARVGASFRSEAVKAYEGEMTPELRKQIEAAAIPATDSAEYIARKKEIFGQFLETLYSGEVGANDRGGPTRDPFEVEVASIVKRDVMALLRSLKDAAGKPLWTGKKDPTAETELTFANGQVRTFEGVKQSYLAKNEKRVHAEADKVLAAKQKARDNAVKLAEQGEDLLG